MSDWRVLSVAFEANVGGYLSGVQRAAAATDKFGSATRAALADVDRLQSTASKLDQVGNRLSVGLTLPMVGLGAASLKASSSINQTFTEMITLGGVAAAEVDGLKSSVFDLAAETGRGPQELAEGLLNVRSAGYEGAQAMEVLEAAAKGAAIGLGTTDQLADLLTSQLFAYGPAAVSAAEGLDVLVAAANASKIEAAALAPQMGRLLPIAAELGVEFAEVAALVSATGSASGDASLAATQLSGVLEKLFRPSKQGAEALASVGLSAESLRATVADKGLLDTITMLRERLSDSGFKKLFDDAQAAQGAVLLTGANAEAVAKILAEVTASAGAADTAFGQWADTMGARNARSFSEIQVAMIQMGDTLAPLAADVLGFAADMAGAFTLLPEWAQKTAVGFGLVTAAAGPMLKTTAAAMETAAGLSKAWNSGAMDNFRLGLMGVSESGAGATNKLGSLIGVVAKSPGVWTVAAAGIGYLALSMNDAREKAERADRAVKGLVAATESGKTPIEAFAAELARALGGAEDSFGGALVNVDTFASRLAAVGKLSGVGYDNLVESLTGTDAEWQAARERIVAYAEGFGDTAYQYDWLIDNLDLLRGSFSEAEGQQKATAAAGEDLNRILGLTTDGQSAAADAARDLAGAQNDVMSAFNAARSAADGVAAAHDQVANANNQLASAQRGLIDAHKGVESAARGVRDAEEAMADARRGLADASAELAVAQEEQRWGSEDLIDAQRGVVDAERALADAQRESKVAQEDLNLARLEATERLEEMARAVQGGELDEREARLALIEARERQANPGEDATANDRERATIAVLRAQERLDEVLRRNAEREAELAAEQAKGVDGSAEVVAAKEAIEDAAKGEREAQEGLADAHKAVAEAQEEMAQRVVDAQDRVTEAQGRVREAAERQRDAVDQVYEAQQRVVDQRAAVVEARQAVAAAEDEVTVALAEQLLAEQALKEQHDANEGALREQIDRYLELAATLEPDSPLRRYLIGLAQELGNVEGIYDVEVRMHFTRLMDHITGVFDDVLPFRWGGITEAARWGRLPAHVTTKPTILYGERDTGGEAMIPRLGDYARSMSILNQAADWYGATVVPNQMVQGRQTVTIDPTSLAALGGATVAEGAIQIVAPQNAPASYVGTVADHMLGAATTLRSP